MHDHEEMREQLRSSLRTLTSPSEDGWSERFILVSEAGNIPVHLMALRKVADKLVDSASGEELLQEPLGMITEAIDDLMDAMAEGALIAGIEEQAEESARNN